MRSTIKAIGTAEVLGALGPMLPAVLNIAPALLAVTVAITRFGPYSF